MNYNQLEKIEAFIAGFLFHKPGVKLYSVSILGGNDLGKAMLIFVKTYGVAQSPVHFSETFNYRA